MAKLKKMKRRKITWLIVLCIGFNLTILLQAQNPIIPDTPVGRMAKAYFEAFASDENAMREFTAQNRTKTALERLSLDDRMAQHKQIKGMLQKLEPKKVLKSSARELELLVFSEAIGAWFQVTFVLNEDKPPKLESFGLQPAAAPKDNTEDGYGEWNTLDDLLKLVVQKEQIPGISMVVIRNGQITETAVAGVRMMGMTDEIQISDRFHIGSITKSMTATLIGKQIENGKLQGNTTLKMLFPQMKMKAVYESVTIQQLLTHTAGIATYLQVSDELEAELNSLPGNPSQQRLLFTQRLLNEEPINSPGSAFTYSNGGYSILATITEILSGQSWERQMEELIFNPLEMTTAGIGWPKDVNPDNEPIGHYDQGDTLEAHTDNSYRLGAYIDPAGDVHCSMADLAKYVLAHLNGLNGKSSILSAETFNWLHTAPEKRNYAAGWFLMEQNGELRHEHSGSAGTFMATVQIMPATNEAYVLASNVGDFALDGIFREIIKAYREK